MNGRNCFTIILVMCLLLIAAPSSGQQAKNAQGLTGENLNKLLPTSVFLDGQNVPVQKRNTVGAKLANGKILLVTILETSGYSNDYQGKYVGMLLTQSTLEFGKSEVKPGAYGLGKKKSTAGGSETHSFVLYDLGGNVIATLPAEKDDKLKPVGTIQLIIPPGQPLRLYLGPEFVTLTAK